VKDSKAVLGVHIGHDRGAAVVANGRLVGALAQERVDRRKHSPSPEFPYQAIDALLRYLRLPIDRVAAVGLTYTNVTMEKVLPQLAAEFRDHYACNVPVHGISHHTAHALAAFYTRPSRNRSSSSPMGRATSSAISSRRRASSRRITPACGSSTGACNRSR